MMEYKAGEFITIDSNYNKDDRVFLDPRGNKSLTLGILKITSTSKTRTGRPWTATDSIQMRPKAIYKNSNGYFYKDEGKRVALSELEIEGLRDYIERNALSY